MDNHTSVTGRRIECSNGKRFGIEHSPSWQANPNQFFFGNIKTTRKRNISEDNIQPSAAAISEPLRKGYSGEFLVRFKELNLQKMVDDCRREIYGKTLDPVSFENKYRKIVDAYRRQICKESSAPKISNSAQSSPSKKENTDPKIIGDIKQAKMQKTAHQNSRHKIEPSKPKCTTSSKFSPSWKAKPDLQQTNKQRMVPKTKPSKPKCTTSFRHSEPLQANPDQFFFHNIKQTKKQKLVHQDSRTA